MLISADRAAGEHGRPSPLLRAGGRFWSATPKQTCPRPRPRAQLAFKDSMIHGILQFTLSIAFRYILHRGESRDIRCRESCFYLIHVFFSGDPSAQRRLGHASMFWNSWCGSHRCRVFDTNLPPVQGGTGRVRVPAPLHRTKRMPPRENPAAGGWVLHHERSLESALVGSGERSKRHVVPLGDVTGGCSSPDFPS